MPTSGAAAGQTGPLARALTEPALQPPQPGLAVAQYGRRRIRTHSSRGERLPERLDRGCLAVAGEGEAVLDAMSVNHLARDHLEVALFPPVPAAQPPKMRKAEVTAAT